MRHHKRTFQSQDVISIMAETKRNEIHRCTSRLRTSIWLKCNLIFTIKKTLFFKDFLSWFDQNVTIKWSMKVQKRQLALRLWEWKLSCVAFRQEQRIKHPPNQTQIPTLPQTAYSLLTHVTYHTTIPNQPLKNNLHPLSSWPIIWWNKKVLTYQFLFI